MNEQITLPESLRQQIVRVMRSDIDLNATSGDLALHDIDPSVRLLLDVAQRNPELAALLAAVEKGYSGISFVEEQATTTHKLQRSSDKYSGSHEYYSPVTDKVVRTRTISFVTEKKK